MLVDSPLKRPKGCKASMTKPAVFAAVTLLASAVSSAALAEELHSIELHPIEAKSLRLGDVSGVAYYTVQGQGYRVVVTLAGQGSTPVRFESTLLPGQKLAMSMPGSAGADARTVEFSRQGDHLLVATNPEPID
jgi:hypothetical protein